jgi:hypothetical protein
MVLIPWGFFHLRATRSDEGFPQGTRGGTSGEITINRVTYGRAQGLDLVCSRQLWLLGGGKVGERWVRARVS